jgi:hypothetical protein
MDAKSKLTPEDYFGSHLLEVCNLVETKIGHELNLINHRISWLATSQSFLFVAVATLLSAPNVLRPPTLAFLFSVPIVGLVLCLLVLGGVNAALKVLAEDLLPERAALVAQLNKLAGMSLEPLGPERLTNFFGVLPARWIPITFIVSWIIVLGIIVWYVAV